MGSRGPIKEVTNERNEKLGNPLKRSKPKEEEVVHVTKDPVRERAPSPPSSLCKAGKALWRKLMVLDDSGRTQFEEDHWEDVERLCYHHGQAVKWREEIADPGFEALTVGSAGQLRKSDAFTILAQHEKEVTVLRRELCLTPATKARRVADILESESKLDAFLQSQSKLSGIVDITEVK